RGAGIDREVGRAARDAGAAKQVAAGHAGRASAETNRAAARHGGAGRKIVAAAEVERGSAGHAEAATPSTTAGEPERAGLHFHAAAVVEDEVDEAVAAAGGLAQGAAGRVAERGHGPGPGPLDGGIGLDVEQAV